MASTESNTDSSHYPFLTPRDEPPSILKLRTVADTGTITFVFFHARGPFLEKSYPVGEDMIVSGRIEHFNDQIQMVHPDHAVLADDADDLPLVEPVYPLTQGLSSKMLQKAMAAALDLVPDLPDWLDPAMERQKAWPAFSDALHALHQPSPESPEAGDPEALARLSYDEFLANQLALALVRRSMRQTRGIARHFTGTLKQKMLDALPYSLTEGQAKAVAEIEADLAAPTRMLRLLQGDVGAGKTVVALESMLAAVEAGAQAAMLAPTELLAEQHYRAQKGDQPCEDGAVDGRPLCVRQPFCRLHVKRLRERAGTAGRAEQSVDGCPG